ncbi:MAG: Polysaccharide deacetylase, partial [Alphaproteobacteria bacterium]|nr:Polysaccharide deacetylase [Alphaproteobacteria bacterium]
FSFQLWFSSVLSLTWLGLELMIRKFALLLVVASLPFTGCEKIKKLPFLSKKKAVEATAPPAPTLATGPIAAPPPPVVTSQAAFKPALNAAAAAAPSATEFNSKAAVIALCYHRFEDRPKDSMAIKPADFEQQMQALADNGFTVIKMTDFLAWRRGEKEIPAKSCIVTLDDGWRSGYEVAWPILKKHGYPFTMFIYTNYVKGQPKSGGQSLSWSELEEMRDAGVDIESHTVSHTDLRGAKRGKTPEAYEQFLRDELVNSKKMLEERLGISIKALAYPYGNHNAEVRKIAMEAGYEACFTVYGQKLGHSSNADQLGRYALESGKPQVFASAMKMVGGGGGGSDEGGADMSQMAATSMVTQPMEGETIVDATPTLKVNLATLGEVDPASVTVRLSGVGAIPSKYDAVSKSLEAKVTQPLKEPHYSVIVSAMVKGRKIETRWSFNYGPAGGGPSTNTEAPLPPRATPAPLKAKKR